MGTFGGALEARKIPAGEGRLTSEAIGEVVADGRRLVLKHIHVNDRLRVAEDQREAAERAHRVHISSCPVAQSIGNCVAITTSLEME